MHEMENQQYTLKQGTKVCFKAVILLYGATYFIDISNLISYVLYFTIMSFGV